MDEKTRSSLSKELYFKREAARYLSVTSDMLDELIASGRIRTLKHNSEGAIFLREDLDEAAVELKASLRPAVSRGQTENRKLFDSADRHLQRAINYFVLQSFYDCSDEAAEPVFLRASAQFDTAEPIEKIAKRLKDFTGDGAVSEKELLARGKRISESFALLRKGDMVIGKDAEAYPAKLKGGKQAPPYLFMRGNSELLSERIIGFTWDKNPEETGMQRTIDLSNVLGEAGILTAGVFDTEISAAIRSAAIQSQRRLISVASMPLTSLPEDADDSGEQGLIISSIPPSVKTEDRTAADAVLFGISDAVILVEGAELACMSDVQDEPVSFTGAEQLYEKLEKGSAFQTKDRRSVFMKGLKVGYVYNDK